MKVKILIVDDSRIFRGAVQEILSREDDIKVIGSVWNGIKALEFIKATPPHLVTLDVQMPDMDGFETAELLRARQKTRHIPIIFVTAISKEPRNVFRGYEKGAVDYLFKPIRAEILISKVRIFTEMHRQRKALEKITEQLQEMVSMLRISEQKLRESEEKYRLLVENIRDIIYELDSQGVVLYISPAVRDILGYDLAEIEGKNFIELAHKDDLGRLTEWFSELRKGIEQPSEYRVSKKSGELRWARTKARPIMEEGTFKGARGILIDVTEQRRVEKALKESEEKYRWVLDNMADVITVMDMNLRFTYVSPSILRMRGYTAEEAVTQTLEQVMTPESLQISAKIFEEEMKLEASGTADPDRIRIVEVEQYRKDGSIVLMENHLSFMRDEAKALYIEG